jgi:signal transduction histidine kinase
MPEIIGSAAYRVAIIYSAAFALAISILGAVLYFAFHRSLLDQLDGRLTNEVIELEADYRGEGFDGLKKAIAEREHASLSGEIGYAVFDSEGQRIAGQLDTPKPPPGARNIVFLDPREGPDPARARVRALGDGLSLVVAADLEPVEQINSTMFSLLLAAMGAVVVIGLVGGLTLGAYLRERLGRISTTAQAIMAGDLTQRMPLSARNDEFDRLSATLNAMLDRISSLLDNLRQVSNDVAHDLRTPLSRLRNRLERALAEDEDLPSLRAAVEDSLGKTDELLMLFSAILRISEVESQKLKRSFVRFNLSEELQEICQSFAPAIEDGGRSLHWLIEPEIWLDGDRELLAQAVINLIENAQKHTPPGTEIDLGLQSSKAGVRLTVADNGPGVAEKDRPRITGRFIRLEEARTTAGHGLGLNLVAAIAGLHRAELRFADNHPGLLVSLEFPRNAPPEKKQRGALNE